jgi:hypothetical protein
MVWIKFNKNKREYICSIFWLKHSNKNKSKKNREKKELKGVKRFNNKIKKQ